MVTLPEAKLYIDGELRGATGGKTYDIIGPWTGEPVGKAADATAEDVEAAIVAARKAFDETDWATNHEKRFELVKKYRELFEANRIFTRRSKSPATKCTNALPNYPALPKTMLNCLTASSGLPT